MRERNTENTYNVMGSKLSFLTQTLFWIVLLKMPAHYLVTFSKANKIWGIIWNERKKEESRKCYCAVTWISESS